jgi:hypothetical protein
VAEADIPAGTVLTVEGERAEAERRLRFVSLTLQEPEWRLRKDRYDPVECTTVRQLEP